MPSFRLTINGTDYDYQTDVIRVSWQVDRDDYTLLNYSRTNDIRRKLPTIRIETVLVAENANATGVSAADLYEKIEAAERAGNTVTFIPDPTASAPNSATPSVDVVTRSGGQPEAYRTEQGGERLRRSVALHGAAWLDPSDTGAGGDKETIDDLNALSDPL